MKVDMTVLCFVRRGGGHERKWCTRGGAVGGNQKEEEGWYTTGVEGRGRTDDLPCLVSS